MQRSSRQTSDDYEQPRPPVWTLQWWREQFKAMGLFAAMKLWEWRQKAKDLINPLK